MTSHTLRVVLFLLMQYICGVGAFTGGELEGFDDELGGIPTEPIPPPPEEDIKMEDLVGDPKNRIISAEALKNMGSSEYSDVIAQVIETKYGPQRFKVDPIYIPHEKIEHDRHLVSLSNDLLDSLPEIKGSGETGNRVKRASFSEGYTTTWPSGIIPYDDFNITDTQFRAWIDAAVGMFNKKTCVQWIRYTNQPHYVKFLGSEKAICAAYIGMRSQEVSPIYLYEVDNTCRAFYVVVHEMLHVIGADHEQSREDRFFNVLIDWNCISKGARQNYLLSLSADEDSEYDHASIMQYNPNLFRDCITQGKYGNKTMTAVNPNLDFLLYELVNQLTHYDVKAITEAYQCNEGCTDNCQNGGFVTTTVENPSCHCVCPKYFSGDQCTVRLNADECGSHTILEKYQPKIVKSTGYDNGFYELDRECIFQFTSPPGTRIKLEFVDMEITVSDAEVPTCIHFVEVIVNLMGQAGPEECGVSTNLTYFTSINSESNMAMLNLNTMRAGSPSRGFMLQATAFDSECLNHPCQNGGRCRDEESPDGTYHFECDCVPGYSGDRCDYVTADATVGCDAETGVNVGVCCMRDTKEGELRFYEYRPSSPTYSYAYLYADSPVNGIGGTATLVSSVTLEPAFRCLSFFVAIRKGSYDGLTTYIQVTYTSNAQAEPLVLYETDDTESTWRLKKNTLPDEEDVRIQMTVTTPAYSGIVALNNILITPGACYVCDSSPCLNGGTCSESEGNDQEFNCLCPLGYLGSLCETSVCDSSPCDNGGECEITDENAEEYKCNCELGYVGLTCEQYVCDPSPCQNGGECQVTDAFVSQYECVCTLGYYGTHCEQYICEPNPCHRGGTCSPVGDTYECACLYGTGGKDCSVDLTTFCSFDDNSCDFQNSVQDSCDWKTREGPPPTLYTGPKYAFSGETYLFVDANENKGKMCRFELNKQFHDSDRCIILFYLMSGRFVDSLRVNMEVNGQSTNLWSAYGNKGQMWKHAMIDISTSSASNTAVQVDATTRRFSQGDIAIDNIQIKPYPCSKIVLCTFEEGLTAVSTRSCVKLNPEVNYNSNWRVRQRPSQQVGRTNAVWTTGPTKARNGYRYAFIDSSYNVDAAMEVKHSFIGPACFSIGYHMNGINIGTLSVKLVDDYGANEDLAWSISGPQGDQWHYTEFDIDNVTNRRIIVTADKGNKTPDDEGDIGIDDIMVVNQPCEL